LAEIDFYAPKLGGRVGSEAPFLGETAQIKPQKMAEYCQRRSQYHFEKRWISRML
jgi:hypothetical protein